MQTNGVWVPGDEGAWSQSTFWGANLKMWRLAAVQQFTLEESSCVFSDHWVCLSGVLLQLLDMFGYNFTPTSHVFEDFTFGFENPQTLIEGIKNERSDAFGVKGGVAPWVEQRSSVDWSKVCLGHTKQMFPQFPSNVRNVSSRLWIGIILGLSHVGVLTHVGGFGLAGTVEGRRRERRCALQVP